MSNVPLLVLVHTALNLLSQAGINEGVGDSSSKQQNPQTYRSSFSITITPSSVADLSPFKDGCAFECTGFVIDGIGLPCSAALQIHLDCAKRDDV
jgi:hypothetical protein